MNKIIYILLLMLITSCSTSKKEVIERKIKIVKPQNKEQTSNSKFKPFNISKLFCGSYSLPPPETEEHCDASNHTNTLFISNNKAEKFLIAREVEYFTYTKYGDEDIFYKGNMLFSTTNPLGNSFYLDYYCDYQKWSDTKKERCSRIKHRNAIKVTLAQKGSAYKVKIKYSNNFYQLLQKSNKDEKQITELNCNSKSFKQI